ncbi:hypothetical protein [Streptomyces sp. NPDC048442]|uniref:aromatic-ring hydroxylase C-terminal domain-containing protein n=1 Tax=Streptomyces sp. NPDC048442 TaxID=3154823 RepID=UPI00344124B9
MVQGRAGQPLLDSYERERHPVGRQALRVSGAITRGVLRSPRSRLVRALREAALPAVNRLNLLTATGERLLSGIGIAYPAPRGSHLLAGRRVPDLRLSGGQRLYEVLRDGRFVLVTHGRPVPETEWLRLAAPAGNLPGPLLIRPDGYIAWAANAQDPDDIRTALRNWPAMAASLFVRSPPGCPMSHSPPAVLILLGVIRQNRSRRQLDAAAPPLWRERRVLLRLGTVGAGLRVHFLFSCCLAGCGWGVARAATSHPHCT